MCVCERERERERKREREIARARWRLKGKFLETRVDFIQNKSTSAGLSRIGSPRTEVRFPL